MDYDDFEAMHDDRVDDDDKDEIMRRHRRGKERY
jgi:hypothetical protein